MMIHPGPSPIERLRAAVASWPVPPDVEPLQMESSERSGFLATRVRLRESATSEGVIFFGDVPPETVRRDLDRLAATLRRRATAAAPLT